MTSLESGKFNKRIKSWIPYLSCINRSLGVSWFSRWTGEEEKYWTFPLSVITWTLYISCHVVSIFTKCSHCSISERCCAWRREGGEWVGVKGWRTNAATLGEEVKSFKRYSVTRSNVDLKWKPFFGMWVREGSRTAKKYNGKKRRNRWALLR